MNKFKVIRKDDSSITIRWIDIPWFEEHLMGRQSFMRDEDFVNLKQDNFYFTQRISEEDYKLCNVRIISGDEDVYYYEMLNETLSKNLNCDDGIGCIKHKALLKKRSYKRKAAKGKIVDIRILTQQLIQNNI
jgi:hypothetical protein